MICENNLRDIVEADTVVMARMKARIEELEEALRPFAEAGQGTNSPFFDITDRDLRRARALLKEKPE